MLIEAHAANHLLEHGYVVIDLLDAAQVDDLRASWLEIEAAIPPVWDPTGMATTVRHPESHRIADDAIRTVAAPVLAEHVADQEPFFSAFITKMPGSGPLPAHLDWALLDESIHATHGCWIALEDIREKNGVLGVVPGSHLLVDFARTPHHPGHEWAHRLIEAGHDIVDVPVSAGQAVVFDHRLIHSSRANESDTPRLAANIGLAPTAHVEAARSTLLDFMRLAAGDQVEGVATTAQPETAPVDAGANPISSGGATDEVSTRRGILSRWLADRFQR